MKKLHASLLYNGLVSATQVYFADFDVHVSNNPGETALCSRDIAFLGILVNTVIPILMHLFLLSSLNVYYYYCHLPQVPPAT